MNNNETLRTITKDNFLLPGTYDGEFSSDEIADDAAGLEATFLRIKIPSGGQTIFEIPNGDSDNPDYEKTLVGVILHGHPHNAYWEDSDNDESVPPDCFSVDGVCGVGMPGGVCQTCQFNQWKTGPNGKGKACKNMHVIYLLRSGDIAPIQFTLPPTSIKPYSKFFNEAFRLRRRATYGSVVEIGLKRIEGDNDYSVATFKKLFDFDGEQLAVIRNYTHNFKNEIKRILQERASEIPNADDIPYAADWNGNTDASDEFDISSKPVEEINGDVNELPE